MSLLKEDYEKILAWINDDENGTDVVSIISLKTFLKTLAPDKCDDCDLQMKTLMQIRMPFKDSQGNNGWWIPDDAWNDILKGGE